jgi:DNA primase
VEEIKERLDIVEVISPYVRLRKAGRTFKGLCPFHTEKTPSFIVYPDGHYHCFGCGASGDVFTFVMRTENLEFREALQLLAERAGVVLESRPQAVAEDKLRPRLRELLAAATQYYHNLLLRSSEAQAARQYVAHRGLTAPTVEGWQLGYALESWDAASNYLLGRGYSLDDLVAAGMVVERQGGGYYDRFRHRLLFPIRDAKGNVTGFGARALGDEQPKYLNSPQTLLFDKSATLYGIEHAQEAIRRRDQVIIVEGYMDVLIPHQMGISNVVASLGTALTDRQVRLLKRLSKNIILALDADAAGEEATLRGLEVAREALERVAVPAWRPLIRFEYKLDADIRILSLPPGQDPDEVVRRSTAEWQHLVETALPIVDFYFQVVTARLDLTSPKGKSAAVERLIPLIREVPDPVAQAHYVQKLARLVRMDERQVETQLRRAPTGRPWPAAGEPPPPTSREPRPSSPEDYALALLLVEPTLYWQVGDLELGPDDFVRTENRETFAAFQTYISQSEWFELEAFRQTLEPALHAHLDALLAQGASRPPLPGEELEHDLRECLLRLREGRLRAELAELPSLLQEAQAAGDQETVQRLAQQATTLKDALSQVQGALYTSRQGARSK